MLLIIAFFVCVGGLPSLNGLCFSSHVQCLSNAADGVRLSARIVDTPCNEMNTDHFLDVSESL